MSLNWHEHKRGAARSLGSGLRLLSFIVRGKCISSLSYAAPRTLLLLMQMALWLLQTLLWLFWDSLDL